MANIVMIQMCSSFNPEDNLTNLKHALAGLDIKEPTLVCLPESWLAFCQNTKQSLELAEKTPQYLAELSELCKQYNIWLNAGTIATKASEQHYFAASYLFDDRGEVVARYNKIHLFDAHVSDNTKQYQESLQTQAGTHLVAVDSPFGKIGLSVCYDLRFPGLYQALRAQNAELLLVPSAFTTVTGAAHWQPLLQARAIETQSFVIAAAQCGLHANGRETYGHSMIVSPWGDVLEDAGLGCKSVSFQLDLTRLHEIRQNMPVADHNRFKSVYYE